MFIHYTGKGDRDQKEPSAESNGRSLEAVALVLTTTAHLRLLSCEGQAMDKKSRLVLLMLLAALAISGCAGSANRSSGERNSRGGASHSTGFEGWQSG